MPTWDSNRIQKHRNCLFSTIDFYRFVTDLDPFGPSDVIRDSRRLVLISVICIPIVLKKSRRNLTVEQAKRAMTS